MQKTQNIQEVIEKVANQSSTEEDKKVDSLQVLVFELGGEEYAMDIADLREIIRTPEITPVPNSPAHVSGILNLRGSVVVVLDLAKKFHLKLAEGEVAHKKEHIIVTEEGASKYGIMVDNVKEVVMVDKENIQNTPEIMTSKIDASYLNGVVVLEEDVIRKEKVDEAPDENAKPVETEARLLILLDVKKLLSGDDLQDLGDQAAAAEVHESAEEKPEVKPEETPEPKPEVEASVESEEKPEELPSEEQNTNQK